MELAEADDPEKGRGKETERQRHTEIKKERETERPREADDAECSPTRLRHNTHQELCSVMDSGNAAALNNLD